MNPVRVLIYLRKHPSRTCRQIARALGEKPALVSLALRELRELARVESAGRTQATVWSVTQQ